MDSGQLADHTTGRGEGDFKIATSVVGGAELEGNLFDADVRIIEIEGAGDTSSVVVRNASVEIRLGGSGIDLSGQIAPTGSEIDSRGGVDKAGTEVMVEGNAGPIRRPACVGGFDFECRFD